MEFGLRRAQRDYCGDRAADELGEFFARDLQVGVGNDGLTEVDFDFSQAADGMEAASFGGDKLHVFEEDRDHRKPRFLGDVIKARLARTDTNTIAASAFRKNNEEKFVRSA